MVVAVLHRHRHRHRLRAGRRRAAAPLARVGWLDLNDLRLWSRAAASTWSTRRGRRTAHDGSRGAGQATAHKDRGAVAATDVDCAIVDGQWPRLVAVDFNPGPEAVGNHLAWHCGWTWYMSSSGERVSACGWCPRGRDGGGAGWISESLRGRPSRKREIE